MKTSTTMSAAKPMRYRLKAATERRRSHDSRKPIASSPEAAATTNPTPMASHSTPVCASVSRRRDPYRPAPSVIGVASRKLKRAADSRVSPRARPAVMVAPDRLIPGSSASAWLKPIVSAAGALTCSSSRLRRPKRSASHSRIPPDHEEAGDREARRVAVAVERVADELLEREADDRRRDRRGHEQPRDAPIGVRADAPFADARPRGPDVPHPVSGEVHEERDERSEMEEDVEGQRADELVLLPAEDPRRQLEVRRGADRDELGQPLQEADDRGLDDDVQVRLTG